MFFSILLLALLAQASPEAEGLWQSGNRQEARTRMVQELQADSDNTALRVLLVRRELEMELYQAALEHCAGLPKDARGLRGEANYFLTRYEAALLDLDLEAPHQLLMRAEALRALGRFDALDALQPQLIEVLGARNPDVLLIQARQALRSEDHERATPLLRAVLQERPLDAEALFSLGRVLVRSGQREEGLALLEKHRQLTPLLDALDFARRGVVLAPRGASNQAALGDAWRDLIPFDPEAAERAQSAFDLALEVAQPNELTAVALRSARFRHEVRADLGAAIAILERALASQEDVRLRVRVADYLVEQGQPKRALEHLLEAQKLRPTDGAIQERIEAVREQEDQGERQ